MARILSPTPFPSITLMLAVNPAVVKWTLEFVSHNAYLESNIVGAGMDARVSMPVVLNTDLVLLLE